MTNHVCYQCNCHICGDEISLNKKLISRSIERYLCLDCMAEGFSVKRQALEDLIRYYHDTGICSLFAKTS